MQGYARLVIELGQEVPASVGETLMVVVARDICFLFQDEVGDRVVQSPLSGGA